MHVETRRKLRRSQHAERIFGEGLRVNVSNNTMRQIVATAEVINDFARKHVLVKRVHGEVAPTSCSVRSHEGIGHEREIGLACGGLACGGRACGGRACGGLAYGSPTCSNVVGLADSVIAGRSLANIADVGGLATRNRNIECMPVEVENAKRSANGLHATKAREQRMQLLNTNVVDFHIDVFAFASEQSITHTTSNVVHAPAVPRHLLRNCLRKFDVVAQSLFAHDVSLRIS